MLDELGCGGVGAAVEHGGDGVRGEEDDDHGEGCAEERIEQAGEAGRRHQLPQGCADEHAEGVADRDETKHEQGRHEKASRGAVELKVCDEGGGDDRAGKQAGDGAGVLAEGHEDAVHRAVEQCEEDERDDDDVDDVHAQGAANAATCVSR